MQISVKEGDLIITKLILGAEGADVSAEDMLLAAYDVLSRVFGQKAIIRAYHQTDPDTMHLV